MFNFKLILSIFLNMVVFGLLLFLPAGTWHWWRAWVFLGLYFVGTMATLLIVFPGREDLLNERMKPPIQKDQPFADKIVTFLLLASFIGTIVFIPLDVFHFHLMGRPSAVVSALGLVLSGVGWWIISLAFKENRFAAPVVKHQAERHQSVIDTGVYHLVRHPMYLGGALFFLGIPLWLGSYAATLLALVSIGTLILRIRIEEPFLKRELPGYTAYTQRVRYRVIPFVW